MKNSSLFLVLSFYGLLNGEETKNVNPENIFINRLKEKGFDFDKNNQSCKIYNRDLPFAMCQDFIDFLKASKQSTGDLQNSGELRHHAAFLNGDRALTDNATFLLSESAGIQYRQIDFKNLPNVNNKADFEKYLKNLWHEKEITSKSFFGKVVLNLNNLNFLNEENSQVLVNFIKSEIEKPNNQVADNLLLFGTSLKNSQISQRLSKLFKNNYNLSKSEGYIINNSKIVIDDKNCIIDEISYPKRICNKALAFLAAINKYKKNSPYLREDGTIINNPSINNTGTSRILLYGKPGNGKTTIGEVFAKIFDAKLIFMDAASVFGKHFGDTENKIQDHFEEAKKSLIIGEKVVLLIDEIDSIGYSQDKVHSEGSPKVANKLQTCIDEINKFPNSNQLIIIATTNRKHALSGPIESRFNCKTEIVKPKEQDIANKITNIFDKEDIDVDKEILLKAIKSSRNFRDCVSCAEEIIETNSMFSSNDPKKLAEDYKNCISSLQNTYKERFWELVNNTSDTCNKFNPIINTATSIAYLFDRTSFLWTLLTKSKKNNDSTIENKTANLDLENTHDNQNN
jgi:AAA+ superfamily predicted ATPase